MVRLQHGGATPVSTLVFFLGFQPKLRPNLSSAVCAELFVEMESLHIAVDGLADFV